MIAKVAQGANKQAFSAVLGTEWIGTSLLVGTLAADGKTFKMCNPLTQ